MKGGNLKALHRSLTACYCRGWPSVALEAFDGPLIGGRRPMDLRRARDWWADRRTDVGLLRGSIDPAKCRGGTSLIDPGQGLRPRLTGGHRSTAGCEES